MKWLVWLVWLGLLGCKNKLARSLGLCLFLISLLFLSRNAGVHSCAVVEFAEAAFKVLGVQPTGSVTANQPGALSSTWWVFQ